MSYVRVKNFYMEVFGFSNWEFVMKIKSFLSKKYAFLPFAFALLGCGEHSFDSLLECSDIKCLLNGGTSVLSVTGWLANGENLSLIPQDIMSFTGDASSLPSSFSLESKFPPIDNQGQYGTCVAWAVGYNLKTALNGMDNNWSSSDLAKPSNQTSPKDLWMTLPSDRSENCSGTSFEVAMNALNTKGARSMAEVPYSNMNCSGTSYGKTSNKLATYRKIAYNERLQDGSRVDGMDASNFKGYLSQGRPIVIGAKLGDRFMGWNSAAVISSDTYNEPDMQHAYHAMVLSGYDDSKNAFRVRNSWGPNWGDKGSIWVDYDFFVKNFCFAAFVAQNPTVAPQNDWQLASGYDLLVSLGDDFPDQESTNPRNRAFSYEIFNNGSKPVLASQKWSVLYLYYNAYDANEYEIIYEDYYTDEFGKLGDYGEYAQTEALAGGTWNHVNVEPGKKAGEAEFGDVGFQIFYTMPNITGDYYLVVFADAYENIQESNENNNFYFITAANGKPLKFNNGILQSTIANSAVAINNALAKKTGRSAPAASVAELGELNGYTPQEIKYLIKQSKQNGVLAKKIAEYRETNNSVKKLKRIAR